MRHGVACAMILAAVLTGGACGGPPSEAPAPPPTSAPATVPAAPTELNVVPPREAGYDEMWSGLRSLDVLVKPVASHSVEAMNEALEKHGGSVPAGEITLQTMIVGDPDGPGSWMVFYTDAGLLEPDTQAVETPVAEALRDALYAPSVAGAVFNPYTAVSRYRAFEYRVDRMYLAGLVGYLEDQPPPAASHCDAADAAHAASKPFVALHHALLAMDSGQDWKRCEAAKLSALWELDFPGARDMALKEAEWFAGQPEANDATHALLERFRKETKAPPAG